MKIRLWVLLEDAIIQLALLTLMSLVRMTRLARDKIELEGPGAEIEKIMAKMPAKYWPYVSSVNDHGEEVAMRKPFVVGLTELQEEALGILLKGTKLPKLPKQLPADLVDRLKGKKDILDAAQAALRDVHKIWPKEARSDAELVAAMVRGYVKLKLVTMRQLGLILAANCTSGGLSSEQRANWLSKESAEFSRRLPEPIGSQRCPELDGECTTEGWTKQVDEVNITKDMPVGKRGLFWRLGFRPVFVPNKKNKDWSIYQPKKKEDRRIFTRMIRQLAKRPAIKVGRTLKIKSGSGIVSIQAIPNVDAPVDIYVPWKLFFDSWALLPRKVYKGEIVSLESEDVAEVWLSTGRVYQALLRKAIAKGISKKIFIKKLNEDLIVPDVMSTWIYTQRELKVHLKDQGEVPAHLSSQGIRWFNGIFAEMLRARAGLPVCGTTSFHIRVFGKAADAWRALLHPVLPPSKKKAPEIKRERWYRYDLVK